MACSAVALAGITLARFFRALILLGLRWNICFIGSTVLLTETYATHEKYTAQGLNKSILFGSVAIGNLSSRVSYEFMGWELMNWIAFPVGLICLITLFFYVQ